MTQYDTLLDHAERLGERLAELVAARDKLLAALRHFANEETCPVNDECVHGFVAGANSAWGWARNRVGQIVKTHESA